MITSISRSFVRLHGRQKGPEKKRDLAMGQEKCPRKAAVDFCFLPIGRDFWGALFLTHSHLFARGWVFCIEGNQKRGKTSEKPFLTKKTLQVRCLLGCLGKSPQL